MSEHFENWVYLVLICIKMTFKLTIIGILGAIISFVNQKAGIFTIFIIKNRYSGNIIKTRIKSMCLKHDVRSQMHRHIFYSHYLGLNDRRPRLEFFCHSHNRPHTPHDIGADLQDLEFRMQHDRYI